MKKITRSFSFTITEFSMYDLPLPEDPTSFDLARVANYFISLGEKEAVNKLIDFYKLERGMDRPNVWEQIGWICRLIFMQKTNKVLRPPYFGGLRLPFNTMKFSDWPVYPLAESNGVYFVLSEGYRIGGQPEDPRDYIKYCQREGMFRKEYLIIPSEKEAEKALDSLLKTEVWKKIKWRDGKWSKGGRGGFSYDISENEVVSCLRRQTKKDKISL